MLRVWQDEEGTDCCIIEEMIVMVEEDQMSLENDSTTQIAQILPHDEDLYTTDRNNNNTPVEDISIIQALKVNSHMNFKDYEAIVTSSPKRNFAEMSADLVVPAQEISTQTEISSEGSNGDSSEDDSKIGDTSENVTDDEDDITEFTVLTSPMCKANRIKSLSTNDIGAGILLITSAKHQENVAEIIVPAKDSSTQTDFIDDDEEPNESIADESFPVYAVAKKSAFRSQTLNSFFPSQMQLNVIRRKGQ